MTTLTHYNESKEPDGFSWGVDIIKDTTGKEISVNAHCDLINVWESLFAKSMQAQVQFTDIAGLFDKADLQASDKLRITIIKEPGEPKIEHVFRIISITKGSSALNTQAKTLVVTAFSEPAALNRVRTVSKSMTGTLDDIVTRVCKDYLDIPKVTVEATDGDKTSICFPNWQPFKVLQYCADHAVSVTGGINNSLYFFYETQDGFYFKTATQIYKDGKVFKYQLIPSKKREDKSELAGTDYFRIQSYHHNHTSSVSQRLNQGMYENEILEFNLMNRKIVSKKFDYSKQYKDIAVIGTHPVLDLAKNFESFRQKESKFRGALSALRVRSNDEGHDQINTYGRKYNAVIAQKNAFNAYSYTLSIYGNPAMRAGDVMTIEAMQRSAETEKEADKLLSGKYLVSNVRHRIEGGTRYHTWVDIFKDTLETPQTPHA